MSVKLSNIELALLRAAARRDDRSLEPPDGEEESARVEIAAKLLAAGLAREIKTKTGAPVWRRDEYTGKSFSLKLTAAGRKAIVVDAETRCEDEETAMQGAPDADLNSIKIAEIADPMVEANAATPVIEPAIAPAALCSIAVNAPRDGTKIADVLGLLQRDEGATLEEVISATGWLPHTSRAALTGLRKRGYGIGRRARPEGGSAYVINVAS
jgi:hypothetical protein